MSVSHCCQKGLYGLRRRLDTCRLSHPDLYGRLCKAQLPPPLPAIVNVSAAKVHVSDILYLVVTQLKQSDLLQVVAFQLKTYGAFNIYV